MKNLEGWKTIITASLTTLAGVLAMVGVELPGGIVDEASGAIVALMGVVFAALRTITNGPIGWKK